jgi:hypothetical protein
MTDEQVQSMLLAIRSAAETLHGEGYHHPNAVPTQAAYDIRFLLAHFDRPQLDPNGCAALVGNWIQAGTYRSVIHRHDGTFIAADESERKMAKADTLPLLSDLLLGWPQNAEPLPESKYIKVKQ